MPIAGQTRKVARQALARNLMGARFHILCATGGADTTSVVDAVTLGGYNACELKGAWVRSINSCNCGEVRRALSNTACGDITTSAFSNVTASGHDFEVWKPEFNPLDADLFLDDAIVASYGRGFAPLESEALHTGGDILRYSLPSTYSYLSKIMLRTFVVSKQIHSTNTVFDEATDGDITQSVDSENQRTGPSCLKLVVAVAASAGDFISDSLASTDFSWGTHLEFWVKSNVTIAAGAITILIDDTASVASAIETLNVPALTADEWTFVRVALAAPEDLTAVISFGIKFDTDTGAQVVYFNDFNIVDENTAFWEPYHPSAWHVDKANRGFFFDSKPSYGLLRLVGGQEPQKMTADSGTIPIDDEYVIAKATASMFAATHMDKYNEDVIQWEGRAANAYKGVARPAFARFLR